MEEKSILITGCSSGIGLTSALALKERGYRVFASARKENDVARLRAQGLESLQLDVNDKNSMQKALDQVLALTGGKLDALFNNAGMLQAGAIEDLSRDQLRAQFETNVFGPMELVRLVLPIMRKQGQGRIIQNSSILGIITLPYYGAYNASKFALEAFSQTLRQELRGTSIHVSLINPGPITTQLRDNAYQLYQQQRDQRVSSAHEKEYTRLEQTYFKKQKNNLSLPSSAVVKQLIHALEHPKPSTHYFVGRPAQSLALLHRLLPDCAMEWVLSKMK